MRVLLIHEHGRSHGSGAVVAMYRLHRGLRKAGVESTIACRKREQDSPDIVELPRADLIEGLLGRASWRLGLNDVHCVSTFRLPRFKPFAEADVVNIHGWHTNYFNYLALPRLARVKPIVGTMHDMWHLTGHCASSYTCDRWKTGCGKCPQLDTFPPVGRDATALEWKLKKRVYDKSPLVPFVSPSAWLLDQAKQSSLRNHALRQIPNPVDPDVYRPMRKDAARARLGIPADKHVIMFISLSLGNWMKGGDLLADALKKLPDDIRRNAVLLLMGEQSREFAEACGIPAISLGYVHEDARKMIALSAADILVQPSRAEVQSIVILEAMSCETPAVAFDTGGMGEIVRNGPGGILAPPEDTDAFSNAMAELLRDPELRASLGRTGRQSVADHYSIDRHVDSYIKLYEETMTQWSEARSAHPADFEPAVQTEPA